MPKKIAEGQRVLLLENDGWEYVERKKGKTAVAVLAVTDDGHVILIEQLRRPVGKRVVDWPAGLVGDEDENADAAETAKKELEEETGYTCDSVELLASGPSSPGIVSEIVSFYRARGVRRIGEGGGVGDEDIDVHAVPLHDIRAWLQKKKGADVLIDLKIWGGLYWLSETPNPRDPSPSLRSGSG